MWSIRINHGDIYKLSKGYVWIYTIDGKKMIRWYPTRYRLVEMLKLERYLNSTLTNGR